MKQIVNFFEILKEVIFEIILDVAEFVVSNLYNVYKILMFICPYSMMFIGIELYEQRGALLFGGEMFIPVIVWICASIARRTANKSNRGDSIPVPRKRFTEASDELDGYTVNQDDINEIILYLGEVEDYLEKRRLL